MRIPAPIAHATIALPLLLTACERELQPPAAVAIADRSDPPATRPSGGSESPPEAGSNVAEFLGYEAPRPANWTAYPPENPMRAANWVVPGASGEDQAHIVVFQGIGGDVQANIDRWQAQFQGEDNSVAEPTVSEIEADGLAITVVELTGGYRGMGAVAFEPDHTFLGAMWTGASGAVQVRLVGRTATVESARDDFMRFLGGIKQRNLHQVAEFPESWFYTDRSTGKRFANTKLLEGHAAPELTLEDWIGEPVTLESLRGKIVVVDFWATWCGPCMRSLPHNVELVRNHAKDGVAVIGVHDSNRGFERMPSVARAQRLNYPTAVDVDGKSTKAWKVAFWPTYAVLDGKGIVRAAGLSPDHVEDAVQALLRERDQG